MLSMHHGIKSNVDRKRIFVSYHQGNDDRYKNLLHSWNNHNDFDVQIYDGTIDFKISGKNAIEIKSEIKPLIDWCSYLLCIIGEKTHESELVDWEIKTALATGKKLVAVKVSKNCVSPPAVMHEEVTWALSFNYDAIKLAIDNA